MLLPEESTSTHEAATDDALVELARAGSASAYGELWRRHAGVGRSIARRYYEIADADDLVSESFARILSTLLRGGGPRSGFRPYLIATIGNVARRWATRSREEASDELDSLEDPKTVNDPVVAATDREFALEAFRSLPDRWQAVLWYSAVEGMGPTDVARHLGMSPNAAAVLAHRARAGLRTAWVQAHLNDASLPDECRWTSGRLGRRATGSLGTREHDRVRLHLKSCVSCRARAAELDQLSTKLAVLLVPALLGLGLARVEPDEAAAAAAAIPEVTVPALTTSHLWLAGIAVVVVTATALLTSSTPPATGDAQQALPSLVSVSSDFDRSDVLSEPAAVQDPSLEPDRSTAPTGDAEIAPANPPAPSLPAEVTVAPAAPAVSATIDPDATRPPALTGSAAPRATILVTDELGSEITRTTADGAGAWATGELAALSPAASTILIRQVGNSGLVSPAAAITIAPRPQITGPADGFSAYEGLPFDVSLDGWPGATVQASFESIEYNGYREPMTYPVTQAVFDAEGKAIIRIDGNIFWWHHATFTYVDTSRASTASNGLSFELTHLPD